MRAPASWYLRVRTGRLFLWMLSAFCAVWIAWNLLPWLPRFDGRGFPLLTLVLSVEASIATSVVLDVQQKSDEIAKKQVTYTLHLMEAVHAHIVGGVAPSVDSQKMCGVATDFLDGAAEKAQRTGGSKSDMG